MRAARPRLLGLVAAIAAVATLASVPPATASSTDLRWERLEEEGSAGRLAKAAAVFMPSIGKVVMFGGSGRPGCTSDDTFVFDGASWTELPLTWHPSKRMTQMTYDAARREVVLFAGIDPCADGDPEDTWTFDGHLWTELHPRNSPPPLDGAAMAYDPVHQEVVLFGGRGPVTRWSDQTWVWDGTNWEQRHPETSPPPRTYVEMAYSKQHGGLVMFGGWNHDDEFFGDTWLWDGDNWRRQHGADGPEPRISAGIVSVGRRVLLFGGRGDADAYFGDTWIYGARGWRELAPSSGPSPRDAPALAYDRPSHSVLLYGGADTEIIADTWRLRLH